jgi:hypothetical protein
LVEIEQLFILDDPARFDQLAVDLFAGGGFKFCLFR